jgi:hypothetical protein
MLLLKKLDSGLGKMASPHPKDLLLPKKIFYRGLIINAGALNRLQIFISDFINSIKQEKNVFLLLIL